MDYEFNYALIRLSTLTTEQLAEVGIRTMLTREHPPSLTKWANDWLSGADRRVTPPRKWFSGTVMLVYICTLSHNKPAFIVGLNMLIDEVKNESQQINA